MWGRKSGRTGGCLFIAILHRLLIPNAPYFTCPLGWYLLGVLNGTG